MRTTVSLRAKDAVRPSRPRCGLWGRLAAPKNPTLLGVDAATPLATRHVGIYAFSRLTEHHLS